MERSNILSKLPNPARFSKRSFLIFSILLSLSWCIAQWSLKNKEQVIDKHFYSKDTQIHAYIREPSWEISIIISQKDNTDTNNSQEYSITFDINGEEYNVNECNPAGKVLRFPNPKYEFSKNFKNTDIWPVDITDGDTCEIYITLIPKQ